MYISNTLVITKYSTTVCLLHYVPLGLLLQLLEPYIPWYHNKNTYDYYSRVEHKQNIKLKNECINH